MRWMFVFPILLFVFSIAIASQANDVVIYQSVPNPSIGMERTETVYFVFYNTGNQTVYVSNLVHDWGGKNTKKIISSYIGNDKVGYDDIKDITYYTPKKGENKGRYVKVDFDSPIAIEPGNYVEWKYTFLKTSGGTGWRDTNVSVYFNDSSSKQRSTYLLIWPIAIIQTDFKIDNYNYSTAEGADDGLGAQQTVNISFRISDFSVPAQLYSGNITITFPDEFSNITPLTTGNVTPVCFNNTCNCSVLFTINTPEIFCDVQATLPNSSGYYVIYANASKNQLLPFDIMKSVSELIVRVKKIDKIPPVIHYVNATPTTLYFGNYVDVYSKVTDNTGVAFVKARIKGPVNREILLTKEYNHVFHARFYPSFEGDYDVSVYAEDVFGNNASFIDGKIHVLSPVSPPSPIYCNNITSLGVVEIPGVIDSEKLLSLFNLSYYCAKNVLGLWDYDFYLEITYPNGSFVFINDTALVYGRYPGKTIHVYGLPSLEFKKTAQQYPSSSPQLFPGGVQILTPTIPGIKPVLPPKITPQYEYVKLTVAYDRFAILKIGDSYKLVKVRLGVWA